MFVEDFNLAIVFVLAFSFLICTLIYKKKELRVRDKSLEITLILFILGRILPFYGPLLNILGTIILVASGLYILTTVQLLSQSFNVYKINNRLLTLCTTAIGYLYSIFGITLLSIIYGLSKLILLTPLSNFQSIVYIVNSTLDFVNTVELIILIIGSIASIVYSFVLFKKHK